MITKQGLNRRTLKVEDKLPIKVVQFGEGNFLRAFIGYAFQELNKAASFNAGIAIVQPIENGMVNLINDQDGLYTLFMKGRKGGQDIQEHRLITNVVKGVNPYTDFQEYLSLAKEDHLEFVISNTTEAGIAYVKNDSLEMQPPRSFPAKLTVFLYERFKHFNGDSTKGLKIIPCELINYNAKTLKEIILRYIDDWELGLKFKIWILECNSFHNTLVDRIVPGYPKNDIEIYTRQLAYKDDLIVAAEPFFLWVIEGGAALKKALPFSKTTLDVKIVEDMQPYRTRKVRILNGAHTAMVPFSLLYGNTTVKETIEHPFTGAFVEKAVFNEIIATLDMDEAELAHFAEAVFDRFKNPFIVHKLSSIALNTVSKFKVRVLPSLLEYLKLKGALPMHLTFAFACLIQFYKGHWKGAVLPVQDSAAIEAQFSELWKLDTLSSVAKAVLGLETYWGENLNEVKGLTHAITYALEAIESKGIEQGFLHFSKQF
jgi:tagaturonate reductase